MIILIQGYSVVFPDTPGKFGNNGTPKEAFTAFCHMVSSSFFMNRPKIRRCLTRNTEKALMWQAWEK